MLAASMAGSLQGAIFVLVPIAGCVLVTFGIFQLIRDLRSAGEKKMLGRLKEGGTASASQETRESILRRRAREVRESSLDSAVGKLAVVPKLQRTLDQANVDWDAGRMLINLSGAALMTGLGVYFANAGLIATTGTIVGVFVMPLLWLVMKRKRRMNKLVEQLPDVFELTSQALRAGHSLASGIHLVSEQMPDPAGTEFGRVFHEQNLGIRIEEALRNMADRVDLLDVRFFVTAVHIQRQTGGDLAEVLDKIGSVIRGRIELYGQVQALTAEGRLSGYVLLALPVLVFFAELQINPKYAGMLIYDDTGRLMLFGAAILQLMGYAMIKKIVNIKV
ncbi:MAG: type II secretion system F family protein [Phycisphaerae bacterium]|nr:type II secretion system F family protein [Phycisphaerae bacterium]